MGAKKPKYSRNKGRTLTAKVLFINKSIKSLEITLLSKVVSRCFFCASLVATVHFPVSTMQSITVTLVYQVVWQGNWILEFRLPIYFLVWQSYISRCIYHKVAYWNQKQRIIFEDVANGFCTMMTVCWVRFLPISTGTGPVPR